MLRHQQKSRKRLGVSAAHIRSHQHRVLPAGMHHRVGNDVRTHMDVAVADAAVLHVEQDVVISDGVPLEVHGLQIIFGIWCAHADGGDVDVASRCTCTWGGGQPLNSRARGRRGRHPSEA
eukprot:scaffold27943_cov54-Prasinocladus_malaysianus.AAC.2